MTASRPSSTSPKSWIETWFDRETEGSVAVLALGVEAFQPQRIEAVGIPVGIEIPLAGDHAGEIGSHRRIRSVDREPVEAHPALAVGIVDGQSFQRERVEENAAAVADPRRVEDHALDVQLVGAVDVRVLAGDIEIADHDAVEDIAPARPVGAFMADIVAAATEQAHPRQRGFGVGAALGRCGAGADDGSGESCGGKRRYRVKRHESPFQTS